MTEKILLVDDEQDFLDVLSERMRARHGCGNLVNRGQGQAAMPDPARLIS